MQHQDYNQIIFTKKKTTSCPQKDDKKNQYLKNDEIPKQVTYNHPITSHLKSDVQKARLSQKKTQAGLASELNLPKDTINKIEAGTAIYDPVLLTKLEKKLNTKFRRPNKQEFQSNFEIQEQ
tara:strand:+ start:3475 stop:3840 length:366 start_codon:yes stop_codon:yes gene_type:complete